MEASDLWPGAPDSQARWDQLLAWLDPRPGECILDVGCGNGAAVALVADRVGRIGRVVGLERSPEGLAKVRSTYATVFPTAPCGVAGLAQALPFADDSFDAVLCVNVLEAIRDRMSALAEMWRVLKPGGRILLAHDDYESLVYAGADRERARRVFLLRESLRLPWSQADDLAGPRVAGDSVMATDIRF